MKWIYVYKLKKLILLVYWKIAEHYILIGSKKSTSIKLVWRRINQNNI